MRSSYYSPFHKRFCFYLQYLLDLWFTKQFMQGVFRVESGSCFVRSEFTPQFFTSTLTYGKFIPILSLPLGYLWLAFVVETETKCCCLYFSYRYYSYFFFDILFCLVLALFCCFLWLSHPNWLEWNMFYKEEKHFPCNFFGVESCSLGIGQNLQGSYISIKISFYYYDYASMSAQKRKFSITFFFRGKLNVLMKILDEMEKIFQVRMFNDINKLFLNFQSRRCRRYCGLFSGMHISSCCS